MVPKLERFFHLLGPSFELDSPFRLEELSSIDSVEFIGPPKWTFTFLSLNDVGH